jgi:hypothetical protein
VEPSYLRIEPENIPKQLTDHKPGGRSKIQLCTRLGGSTYSMKEWNISKRSYLDAHDDN